MKESRKKFDIFNLYLSKICVLEIKLIYIRILFCKKKPMHYNWCISSISNTMYLIYNLIILDSFMISDDAKLIKGNYGNEGNFRVNYDPESWKAIAAQLNNDHEVIEAYRYNYMYYHTNTTVFYLVVRINVVING